LVKGSLLGSLRAVLILASALAAGFSSGAIAADFGPRGFHFDESSTVSGSGEVSIKGSFHDYAVDSSGWMKGSGSISFESLRNMSKAGTNVDLTQQSDLVLREGSLRTGRGWSCHYSKKASGPV